MSKPEVLIDGVHDAPLSDNLIGAQVSLEEGRPPQAQLTLRPEDLPSLPSPGRRLALSVDGESLFEGAVLASGFRASGGEATLSLSCIGEQQAATGGPHVVTYGERALHQLSVHRQESGGLLGRLVFSAREAIRPGSSVRLVGVPGGHSGTARVSRVELGFDGLRWQTLVSFGRLDRPTTGEG